MNSEQQQQRIMGYFIEEAREHLQTIEQGVLNLQDVLNDSESVNELFRAAHSIKGGAAMLGVGSIQHIAHRLEDFFKILQENSQINVDERLKSLLLAGFDPLSELLDELQGGYKISDELTIETNNRVKPVFTEVESYLNQLVSNKGGEISNGINQKEAIPQPQELVVSQESVFQQEITTKMRDMLQLFRGTDGAESRSQLQAICNYFQEIGNNFNLQNWTNLVTQIKNALAESSNSYRTLAPILIRELKEAQDLVLANREAEITVSSQIQNLIPYRFLEPEDDEVSTIFTTASGDIADDLITEDFEIADTATTDNIEIDINSDVDIDLFADQDHDESFDLAEVRENQIDQMDWMDGEYEISENQHIDGPKVGASELKSLAILFENDDIDFDAAWEDIESNETNIANHGATTTSDSQDEFADLLDNASDNNNDVTVINLGAEESSIDQLFGDDFSTQNSLTEENSNSLFPDDLDDSWKQTTNTITEISSEISVQSEQADPDSLFTDDFITDGSLDNQFDIDLGIDIVEQVSNAQINDELQFNDIDISEINVDDIDFSELPDQATKEQLTENGLFDASKDESQSLSSEEYFAAIAQQENEITIDDEEIPNEPFALTFSEEGMTLLEDPFAIDEDLDAALLESSSNIVNEESINSDVDDLFVDSEELEAGNYAELISESNEFETIDTTGLNLFDELGFDNDEVDEAVNSQGFEESVNVESVNFTEDNEIDSANDLVDFFAESSEVEDISSEVIDADNTFNINDINDDFGDFLPTQESTNASNVFDMDSSINSLDEFNSSDDLGDFLSTEEPAETELTATNINSELEDAFVDQVNNAEQLDEDFFASGESELTSSNNISNDYIDSFETELSTTDDLGDFFANSDEPEISTEVNYELDVFADQVDNADDLGDFFADSEEPVITASNIAVSDDFEQEFANVDDLGDFFSDSEDSDIVSSDNEFVNNTDDLDGFFERSEEHQSLINDDWGDFGSELANENESEASNEVYTDKEAFIDFDSVQDANSDFLVEVDDNIFEENPPDLAGDFSDQIDSSDNSDLANLFVNAAEEDLTVLENELNFFDQESSPTQSDDFDDLNDLASIQSDLDFENDSITTKSTIDNLADFFQVDDDAEPSLLEPEKLTSDNLAVVDSSLDFGEFNQFADLDADIAATSDFPFIQDSETKNLEPENQLQNEELNGIDDNFDFDDLEAMIGSSSNMPNSENDPSSRTFESQGTETFINQASVNSDEMDFDELEALLGDSGSFEDSGTNKSNNSLSVPLSSNDDFDELENMLQTKFAKDVGQMITKSPVRQPTATRKPKLTDSTMRVDVKYLDSLNNLVGELVVNRNLLEQDQERLQQFITNLLHQVQLLSDVSQRMRDQYDRSLLEASLTAGRGRSFSSFETSSYSSDGASSNSSVTNDFEGIEFDRYNTFHVLSQEIIELIVRVRESASDIEFVVGETDQVTRQLGTITTQVQDDLKQSRMVPFAQIADRLPRGIRDRALKTGKQAELEIFGRETLVDKAILESLTDPLTHLVNNAIDHGLEDPVTRQAAGKSATGRLTVRVYHQGNQTVISISDDGAGISTEKVKKSAVSKGVRSQSEVDRLNDTEVYSLLFEPGFSTAAQADEFKGRGVGLDVVKTCLDDIRGVIIVESVVGKGTTFTIRLPLTLSISKAMFCISDRARIAFPVDGFEDMVEVPQNQIVLNEKGQPCLPWRDTVLPFQHLSNLLSYSRHLSRSSIYGKQENDELCIIILRNDTSYLALQVDQFLGEYEIVIKQLEGPIPQPAGIAGATVLGDGRVMAIANVLELFDIASGRLRPSTSSATIQPTVEEEVAADPTVLIVDDSITVRELLSLTFAKVGYRVEQAKDGQDAWEKLRAGLPCDMIFCDIEMPRMDGLDLLSRLQKDSRLKDIPVAMLTSRGADRHRQSAIQLGAKGYFTKPYLEEELLSASKRLLAGETLPI